MGAKAAKGAKRRALLWGNTEKTRLHIAPDNCYLRELSFMLHDPRTLNQVLCGFVTFSMLCHNRWRIRMVVPKDEKARLRISSLSS